MRLRSDIVVSALMRRVFSSGGFAAIEHKGAEAAGAIFVRQRLRGGLENLYGPAPQSFAGDDTDGDRRFECRLRAAEPPAVDALLARERKFDADLWIVEIETETLGDLLSLVDAAG